MRLRLIAATGVIVALVAGPSLILSSSATADELPGIALQDLPNRKIEGQVPADKDSAKKSGGWDDNYAGISVWAKGTPDGHKCGVLPRAIFIGEPTWNGLFGNDKAIVVTGEMRGLTESCDDVDARFPGMGVGNDVVVGQTSATCQNGSEQVTYNQHQTGPGQGGYGSWNYPDGYPYSKDRPEEDGWVTRMQYTSQAHQGFGVGTDRAPCERILQLTLNVCGYQVDGFKYVCTDHRWTADRFKANTPYDSANADPREGWQHDLCVADPRASNCPDFIKVDGTDFSQVCANPPAWSWTGGADSLGATVGFYAKCLFFPQNGFDEAGLIQSTFASSSAGSIQDSLIRITSTFKYSQSCGVVADFSGTPTGGVIDTCAWNGQGWNTARTVIAIGLWLGFGWWLANFIATNTTGLVTGKSATPIADGDSK